MATPPHLRALPPSAPAPELEPAAWELDLRGHVERALGAQYTLGEEIGRGGMGIVYRARDRRLDRDVAIKVLPPEIAHDPAIRTRFTGEARTAAQLGHPHIVPIHDVGQHEGVAYFVMALVSGENLGTMLARDPRPPVEEIRRILGEIADALSYAHRRGVIHRDIKPDNILLDAETGRAVVTDFGIARAVEAGARVTATGMAMGTPTYMSPEQALGERDLDGRSDVYALGVLAYQMLTGRVPFTAGSSVAVLLKHVSEAPRPIAELRPEVPRGLRETVERALAKSADDRWPTAAAFRDALERDDRPVWRRGPNREPERALAVLVTPPAPAPLVPSALPSHLLPLTTEQRRELRLWRGRVDLLDRVKAFRGHLLTTVASMPVALLCFAVAFGEGAVPLVAAPAVPMWMMWTVWQRAISLRASGLQVRRALLMPRAKWVFPAPAQSGVLGRLPADVLHGPHGPTLRRAVDDRAAILDLVRRLPDADRALLSDVGPTANALVDRAVHLAQTLSRLESALAPELTRELGARIPHADDRTRALLERQLATFDELGARRGTLVSHLEGAGLALGNLRLDLVKLSSSGLQSAIGDVSTATGEARALSRDIGALLDAAAEIKRL